MAIKRSALGKGLGALITENSKKDVDAIIAVSNSDFSRSEKGMAIVPSVIT